MPAATQAEAALVLFSPPKEGEALSCGCPGRSAPQAPEEGSHLLTVPSPNSNPGAPPVPVRLPRGALGHARFEAGPRCPARRYDPRRYEPAGIATRVLGEVDR